MEFRKMVTITLYVRQQKIYRYIEQSFGLHGERRGWDDLREYHWNKYIVIYETDRQPRLDAWDKCSGLVHWENPEGWDGKEVGGGIKMGNTCKPMADSYLYGKKHYNIVK